MGLKRRVMSGFAALLRVLVALLRGALVALGEVYKLGREMLVIPAQLWLLVAEVVGGAALRVWLRIIVPAVRSAWALLVALYYVSAHNVTPRRTVAAVAVAAAAALVVSQWLDYRAVSVGTPAHQGEVDLVAPAPDIARDRAGEAHAWVMIPIAALGATGVLLAYRGRMRGGWLAVAAGLGAVGIAAGIDAPKGLDEGPAAIAYEGASAHLLEGFLAQIASGAALAGAALLLLAYARREAAPARRNAAARRPARRSERGLNPPTTHETRARLDPGAEGGPA